MDTSGKSKQRRPRRGPRPEGSFDRRRPFTLAEAVQAGVEAKELRTNAFRRLLHNVYVDASVPLTPRLRALAPLAVAPRDAWVSHVSAGRVYGAPLPAIAEEHLSVLVKDQRLRRSGVVCHVAPNDSGVVKLGQDRISGPERLFVELAQMLGLVDLVIVGDWLVRHNWTTVDRLVTFCGESRLPGAAVARSVATHVRERVDSPMETRLRLLITLAGLPEPEVNLTYGDAQGLERRRYDLCWPSVKVIVEYDGRHHVERIDQWESDLDRREAIDDDDWRILVVTSSGLFVKPEMTLAKVQRLLSTRGLPGVPARLSDDWRPHFPGRDSV
jgi:very-short-patch-repair endonuclease